ncbi:MAG: flagellar biosynthesis repressor FlbT [Rhodocyclaceae bacterium]|nr:flagellar biosynthesis repressor FlbT [Rhodocyclaceae bacterium]
MSLKISLKAGERIFVGGAVIQNGPTPCEFLIHNDVPLLREKDILNEDEATSHCRRIQLCVQLMYMDRPNLTGYQKKYAQLVDELLIAAPSTASFVADINHHLAFGEYYHAIKSAKRLVAYEEELIRHAQST